MSAIARVATGSAPSVMPPRPSRRASTRRAVEIPCQVVRERGFVLLADRTLDLSVDGMLVPLGAAVDGGEPIIASFEIPGMWIDVEAVVTRIVHGRRPYDEAPAVGIAFKSISPSQRAALAGYLHGRPPPIPRRGPFARLRRGEGLPQLADETAMRAELLPRPPRPTLNLELDDELVAEDDGGILLLDDADLVEAGETPAPDFGLGVLVELAAAWRKLGDE